jgi:hypothetical protein
VISKKFCQGLVNAVLTLWDERSWGSCRQRALGRPAIARSLVANDLREHPNPEPSPSGAIAQEEAGQNGIYVVFHVLGGQCKDTELAPSRLKSFREFRKIRGVAAN